VGVHPARAQGPRGVDTPRVLVKRYALPARATFFGRKRPILVLATRPTGASDSRAGENTMLSLRPNCEHCNKALPPASSEAMICSLECPFRAACVRDVLDDVCPTCAGGFAPRPVRPLPNWREDNPLGKYPAATTAWHRPVDREAHAAFAAPIKAI